MNARERVLAVLNRETPDRVPVDIWLVPELVEKFNDQMSAAQMPLRHQAPRPLAQSPD